MSDSWTPPEHGSDRAALRGAVTRGLTWTIVDQWGRQLLNLIVFAVIAQLVTQADVGLVALAAVFIAFAQIFIDQGLGEALVQRRELTRAHLDTGFWVSLFTGALLAVAGLLLATPIAGVFGEPELAPILQVLSLSFVLYALSSVPRALLLRELAFRSLALRALFAIGGGSVVGIVMAYQGYGAWALVGQQMTQAALSVVALWRLSPWRPGRQISALHFRQLFSFGINIVGSDILGFISRRTDNLLIGFFLGPVALGLYTVGYRILESAGALLVGIARKIAFPAFARVQHDPERMVRAFMRVTRTSSAVIMPGFLGLALVAPELTVALFGQRWAESGPVASVLFLIGVVYAISAFSGALLNAAGHPEVEFRLRLVTTITNVVGFAIAVQFGILAVAAAYVIRGYLLLPLNLYWLRIYAGVPTREYLFQLRGIAIASAVMAAAVLAVKFALAGTTGPVALLAAEIGAGAGAFAIAIWVVERELLRELVSVAREALPGRRRDGEGGKGPPNAQTAGRAGETTTPQGEAIPARNADDP